MSWVSGIVLANREDSAPSALPGGQAKPQRLLTQLNSTPPEGGLREKKLDEAYIYPRFLK